MTTVSACVNANDTTVRGSENLPDEFSSYYVCVDTAATTRVLRGEANLEAAISQGIDDCPSEYNTYVDFLTREALLANGVRPENGDPSVREKLAVTTRKQTVDHFLPIYKRVLQ